MATSDGWYLIGPLIAVGLVGFLGAVFWRMGLQPGPLDAVPFRDGCAEGLAIFRERAEQEDFGLLCAAAVTDEPEIADEIRQMLSDAGIRATHATRRDGRVCVLVFAEELEEARRLVGA
ncbi:MULTISPECIES: hypothetical protein [Actinoplanes]|uniref:Uncharacterized protein n=2 Tax=Actinoplanes TaxID=1865 RepID=A0A0X3V7A1_9ACTN|nr:MULTISPECIES: hypothetical protein [Actinoplanes]KUL40675.1 hypothetical protein ADL15_06730 [Actinoplanes awajinensis subsp. mycoplanecinus]GIE65501.1 hypothetical protein Apa02nite_016090 [Actinoplanes palleronii]